MARIRTHGRTFADGSSWIDGGPPCADHACDRHHVHIEDDPANHRGNHRCSEHDTGQCKPIAPTLELVHP